MAAARSPEFRHRALELVISGEPVIQVARKLALSESGLRRWTARNTAGTGAIDVTSSAGIRELVDRGDLPDPASAPIRLLRVAGPTASAPVKPPTVN